MHRLKTAVNHHVKQGCSRSWGGRPAQGKLPARVVLGRLAGGGQPLGSGRVSVVGSETLGRGGAGARVRGRSRRAWAEMGRAGEGKWRGPTSVGKGRGPASAGQPDGVGGEECAQMKTKPVRPRIYRQDDL